LNQAGCFALAMSSGRGVLYHEGYLERQDKGFFGSTWQRYYYMLQGQNLVQKKEKNRGQAKDTVTIRLDAGYTCTLQKDLLLIKNTQDNTTITLREPHNKAAMLEVWQGKFTEAITMPRNGSFATGGSMAAATRMRYGPSRNQDETESLMQASLDSMDNALVDMSYAAVVRWSHNEHNKIELTTLVSGYRKFKDDTQAGATADVYLLSLGDAWLEHLKLYSSGSGNEDKAAVIEALLPSVDGVTVPDNTIGMFFSSKQDRGNQLLVFMMFGKDDLGSPAAIKFAPATMAKFYTSFPNVKQWKPDVCMSFKSTLTEDVKKAKENHKGAAGSRSTKDKIKLNTSLMLENMRKVEQRRKALDEAVEGAEDLRENADEFKDVANKLDNVLWWKNLKWTLIIWGCCLCVLVVVVVVVLHELT